MLKKLAGLFIIVLLLILSGCSSSKEFRYKEKRTYKKPSEKEIIEKKSIIKIAEEEQKNFMYTRDCDSTYLYWLDSQLIILHNRSKCNIYAMNVIHKAGYKTPEEYVLTYDLMDTSKYNDVMPIVRISEPEEIITGDLIIWNGHVIIFEELKYLDDDIYALAYWAGTKQKDDGDKIINNVAHGIFPLTGDYIIRRPLIRNK